MYPLKFQNILKPTIWGGSKVTVFKSLPASVEPIGESWELSGVAGRESVVAEGPWAGRNITELVAEYKGALVGSKVYERTGDEFPILVKFIDACDDLSIQVHPDDKLAFERHNGSKGKAEMWYVVQADEGAHLMSGMAKSITPQEYIRHVEDNTITDVLCSYEVKEGDVFFLPAGRIHSIGKGCFIAEIQQTSDIAYRIYDFGRIGFDGKPRQLHVQESMDAVDFSVQDDYCTPHATMLNQPVSLVECDYFKTQLLELTDSYVVPVSRNDSFLIVICLEGEGSLKDSNGNMVTIRQGETVLLPASIESAELIPSDRLKLLTCYI